MTSKDFLVKLRESRKTHKWEVLGEGQRRFIRAWDRRIGCWADPLAVVAMNENPGKLFYAADYLKAGAALGLSKDETVRIVKNSDNSRGTLRGLLLKNALGIQ